MSLQILFSGAQEPNGIQTNSDKSLGGYISSSQTPNGALNELFSDISLMGEQKQYTETRGFFVKNIGAEKTNIKCWFILPADKKSEFEIAAVTAINSNQMESIASFRDSPQIGTFYKPTVDAKITIIPSLPANGVFCIWLRRKILPKVAMTPEQLQAWQIGGFLNKVEEYQLVFEY